MVTYSLYNVHIHMACMALTTQCLLMLWLVLGIVPSAVANMEFEYVVNIKLYSPSHDNVILCILPLYFPLCHDVAVDVCSI